MIKILSIKKYKKNLFFKNELENYNFTIITVPLQEK
jgi:hypothetical protein